MVIYIDGTIHGCCNGTNFGWYKDFDALTTALNNFFKLNENITIGCKKVDFSKDGKYITVDDQKIKFDKVSDIFNRMKNLQKGS